MQPDQINEETIQQNEEQLLLAEGNQRSTRTRDDMILEQEEEKLLKENSEMILEQEEKMFFMEPVKLPS